MIEQYQKEHDADLLQIASALAQLLQGDAPFLLQNNPHHIANKNWDKAGGKDGRHKERGGRFKKDGAYDDRKKRDTSKRRRPPKSKRNDGPPSEGMERYRISLGHDHGVMPGNIVGAIANEADITGSSIGRISIHDDYSLIDLPAGIPNETLHSLKKIWVAGNKLGISRLGEKQDHGNTEKPAPPKGKHKLSLSKGKGRKKGGSKPKRKPRNRRP